MKRRDSLRRRAPFREPRSRVLVVCEGAVTEAEYFRAKGRAYRSLVEVRVESGGVPKTLVERAAQMKKEAARAAEYDPNEDFDEVWCVFDVDDHHHLPDAKQQARDNGIQIAISNPSFELWALLHFAEQRAHIHRDDVRRKLKKHIPGYKKALPLDRLADLEREAVLRARKLEQWQKSQGCEGRNPSTAVHHLTERLRELGASA